MRPTMLRISAALRDGPTRPDGRTANLAATLAWTAAGGATFYAFAAMFLLLEPLA